VHKTSNTNYDFAQNNTKQKIASRFSFQLVPDHPQEDLANLAIDQM
jgi:hypothetical protein